MGDISCVCGLVFDYNLCLRAKERPMCRSCDPDNFDSLLEIVVKEIDDGVRPDLDGDPRVKGREDAYERCARSGFL